MELRPGWQANSPYQIQSSPDVQEWQDLGEKILGNRQPFHLLPFIKADGRGFFRVLVAE